MERDEDGHGCRLRGTRALHQTTLHDERTSEGQPLMQAYA